MFPEGLFPRPFNLSKLAIALREGRLTSLEASMQGRTTRRRIEGLGDSPDLLYDLVCAVPKS